MFDLFKVILLIVYIIFSVKWLDKNNCTPVLKFVFWLVFTRLILAAFHNYTYVQYVGSFSIISFYSILMVVLSFFYLLINNKKVIINNKFSTIKFIIILMVISAILNNKILSSIPSIIKWVFLLQFITILIMSMEINGVVKVLKAVFLAYSYPVMLLILSVLVGESKGSESDGSTSYIGGYYHEAVFSIIVFTSSILYLSIKLIDKKINYYNIILIILVFTTLLLLINYRTTLIASVFAFVFILYSQYEKQDYIRKILYLFFAFLFVVFMSIYDLSNIIERFMDIPKVIINISELFNYPEYYTREEKKLFSGRIYIWSNYVSEAIGGTEIQFFIGQGMDSWKSVFLKYAHNTFISFFYELGIFGVSVLFLCFISIYKKIFNIKEKILRTCILGYFISFVFLNLGTMPMWQMEGIMLFAILIALIFHLKRDRDETYHSPV